MSSIEPTDHLRELRYALAEGEAHPPSPTLKGRVVAAAVAARPPGRPSPPAERISGAEAFRRTVQRLDALVRDLEPSEWHLPALGDLDVQGVLGHLIGVESAFLAALEGSEAPGGSDHVALTRPSALAQAGRPTTETLQEWSEQTKRTIQTLSARPDPETPTAFYGVTMPLDQLLIVRSFEMWIHDEDIRRAASRPLDRPDTGRLARMTELAIALIPAGMARAARTRAHRTARLVLIGAGGGTWDVPLDGAQQSPIVGQRKSDTQVVVDAAAFCRVVGDRLDLSGSAAAVRGDVGLAADLFAGAAALALD